MEELLSMSLAISNGSMSIRSIGGVALSLEDRSWHRRLLADGV
jgi:hypothetical protein